MDLAHTLDIDAPIEQVFAWLDDPGRMRQWMEGLEETVYPGGYNERNPVGTRFRQRIRAAGRVVEYEGEITRYHPPCYLGVRVGSRHFSLQVDYRLAAAGERTRLDCRARGEFHTGLARRMAKMFAGMTRGIVARQLERLKEVAERGRR